ncbi:putative ATP/GTP-binding protein [Desulfosporosinus sp. I2]|uniref:ATP-binding protein n=1 Tax=Desulfosporosinus sp. I2 TaxID=1617025 RepID=UPI0005EDF412|nr:ATP-binding protein [Desulfosporosinus sp. I2]KJR47554.1 putative ATP/GTP-binding protein [Desulfosporosinus sp. I2]
MEQKKLSSMLLALDSLSIYRGLLEDKVFIKLKTLLISLTKAEVTFREVINTYHEFYFELAKTGTMSLADYVLDRIIFDENPFTFQQQAVEINNTNVLEKAVARDLDGLQLIAGLNSALVKTHLVALYNNDPHDTLIEELPEWVVESHNTTLANHLNQIKEHINACDHWQDCLKELKKFHKHFGCGLFARYFAFVWERIDGSGYIRGIDNPDAITLDELVEYQNERTRIIENTLQFLKGFPSNNVLLYGDRGTGKSSTVKAILNEYHSQGLRMLEVPKAYLADFPSIIRHLKNRAQRFIIFVDDLVFGDNEENYTSLKAVLEGGLESKTSNILIYATSNRRHLVKEYFSERAGLQSGNHNEEVHAGDSMQEKLSLADRFGISVVFSSPDQKRYLNIVDGIATNRHLTMDKETLHREALQWALWYNGRSARTARQFVDWIEGHDTLNNT